MAMDQQYTDALKELREAKSRIDQLEQEVETHAKAEKLLIQLRERAQGERDDFASHLARVIEDVRQLIDSSDGVAGLHKNGEIATWGGLTEGGRLEDWLVSLDEAADCLENLAPARSEEEVASASVEST